MQACIMVYLVRKWGEEISLEKESVWDTYMKCQ